MQVRRVGPGGRQGGDGWLAFSAGRGPGDGDQADDRGFGLNWQHCRPTRRYFPGHSFEQYYQAVRRCWRFGQSRPVVVDIVTTEGAADVLANLTRKAAACDAMFSRLVELMNDTLRIGRTAYGGRAMELPAWLSNSHVGIGR